MIKQWCMFEVLMQKMHLCVEYFVSDNGANTMVCVTQVEDQLVCLFTFCQRTKNDEKTKLKMLVVSE